MFGNRLDCYPNLNAGPVSAISFYGGLVANQILVSARHALLPIVLTPVVHLYVHICNVILIPCAVCETKQLDSDLMEIAVQY